MSERQIDWIQTYSGMEFYPLAPEGSPITILDIAHALALTCRFGGHCTSFYSVAQHSVLVSESVPDEHALTALLHDAAEAYLVDIPKPIKRGIPEWSTFEDRVQSRILARYDCPALPLDPSIKLADLRALATERRDLMADGPVWGSWIQSVEPFESRIDPWSPERSERQFLDRFFELYP